METITLSAAALLYGGVIGFVTGVLTTTISIFLYKTYQRIEERHKNRLHI